MRCIKYQEALKRLEADKQDLEKGNTLLTAELSEERNRLAEEKKALIKQLRKDGPPTAKQSSGDSTQQVSNLTLQVCLWYSRVPNINGLLLYSTNIFSSAHIATHTDTVSTASNNISYSNLLDVYQLYMCSSVCR